MVNDLVFQLQPHSVFRMSLLSLWFFTLNVGDGEDLRASASSKLWVCAA
jgi:hypothetical protein